MKYQSMSLMNVSGIRAGREKNEEGLLGGGRRGKEGGEEGTDEGGIPEHKSSTKTDPF